MKVLTRHDEYLFSLRSTRWRSERLHMHMMKTGRVRETENSIGDEDGAQLAVH